MEEKRQNGHFKKVICCFGDGSGERIQRCARTIRTCNQDHPIDLSLSVEGTRADGEGITGTISMIGFAAPPYGLMKDGRI